jgi:hypothetical protein
LKPFASIQFGMTPPEAVVGALPKALI